MATCAIYIRKSRKEKDKIAQRLTVQREQLPAYAINQGWDIVIYDDGHASAALGKTENLKERARLESDIRAGKINIILTIELSRLSRDDTMQDYIAWLTICANHRVKLATMTRTLDPAQHSDWMMLIMEGGFSSVEMKVLQARMKQGRDQAYQTGKYMGGGCPPPYRYDKAQEKPVIDAEQLIKVKKVWELAETMSARRLAMHLKMPLISTRRMLADDRLLFCQALRHGDDGEIIACDWEPCIDAEQAERIRASRRKGYTGPRRSAGGLLSNLGIMICGYCGSTYRGFKGQTRKDGTWTNYYGCRGKETKGLCPKTSMVEQSVFDDRITTNLVGTLDKISNLKTAWESVQNSLSGTDRIKQLKDEQHKLETKKTRLTMAISEGVIDFADAKPQMAAIKQSLEQLKAEQIKLLREQTEEPAWDTLYEAGQIFESISPDEQREVFSLAIKQIRVFPTYLTIEYNFPRSSDGNTTARVHLPTATKHNMLI